MKIFERIEIHRFRSISDTEFFAEDLTIFSGTNNSGKSNVLRALNLFFNAETAFEHPFDFDNDYNRAFTGQAGGKRTIRITVHFPGQGNAALKEAFSISRTFDVNGVGAYDFHSTDTVVQDRLKNDDGNVKRQFSTFLNKIVYFYVPAVRDKAFVQSLFLNFEQLIDDDKGDDFDKSIEDLSNILEAKSQDISRDFESFIQLPTEAALSSRKTDILGAVVVNVDSGIEVRRRLRGLTRPVKVKVDLFSSGDGILMSYLAYFLAHICKKLSRKRYIWGFEEPENSLEYSKVQKLAEDFSTNFVNDAQILVTTHSPAFINLKDRPKSILYRVYINPDDRRKSTEIRTLENLELLQQSLFRTAIFSTEYITIRRELGLVEYAVEVEKTLDRLVASEQDYKRKEDEFESQNQALLNSRPQCIFICEDSEPAIIALWTKLFAAYGMRDVKVISSKGSANDFVENGIAYQQTLDSSYRPRVYRQVDRDGLIDAQILAIQEKLFNKYEVKYAYKYCPLPVNELENFAVQHDPQFDDQFWETERDTVIVDFEKTADAVVKKFDRRFNYEEASGFRGSGGGYMGIVQDMRQQALTDWRGLMPGKSIAKRMVNYNAIAHLDSSAISDLPAALRQYITTAKEFFEA